MPVPKATPSYQSMITPSTDAMLKDLRVPRYTSYPTAPHFRDDFSPDTYGQWLAELPQIAKSLSLYVHIPFCRKLCYFCGCNMQVANQERPILKYLDTLEHEIKTISGFMGGKSPIVNHLHFGGGTPTILEPIDFNRIMDMLRHHYDFAETAEIAVEIDPRTATPEKIDAYAQAGMNRASLGLQDFKLEVQEAVNRVQPYELVKNTIDRLRDNHIKSINVDVMYGLPHQSVDSVRETMQQVLTLSPDRIAVFGYAHVPWMKKHQKLLPEQHMAGIEERWGMYQAAYDVFTSNGYTAIGLDHFAKNTDSITTALHNRTLHRNFQGYTTDMADALIGMGQSSIGWMPQGYIQNNPKINGYKKDVMAGNLPTVKGYSITDEDRQRRDIISSIMCYLDVNLDDFAGQYGVHVDYSQSLARLAPFVDSGDVVIDGNTITITEQGRALMRVIASCFDEYLHAGQAKHSSAV